MRLRDWHLLIFFGDEDEFVQEERHREDGNGRMRGVFPPKLMFTLAIAELESAEEGTSITLDKFGLLRDELTGGMLGAWATFVATYKEEK